ncbi:hypothetical protein R4I06_00955 [Anaplasma bovis]
MRIASLYYCRTLYQQEVVQHTELPHKGVFAFGVLASLVTFASIYSKGSDIEPECNIEEEDMLSCTNKSNVKCPSPHTALVDLAISKQVTTCTPDR